MKQIILGIATVLIFTACAKKSKTCCKQHKETVIPTDEIIVINTKFGEIKAVLYEETKAHKANFLKLTKEGFYDSTTFHRIISGFMIQGGDPNSKDEDPNNDGQGGPGYTVPAEFFSQFEHKRGALAAARIGGPSNPDKRSSGSQFYIVEPKEGTHFLDKNYTVFGEVFEGLEVVSRIALQPKNTRDRPKVNILMTITTETVPRDSVTAWTGYQYPVIIKEEGAE